MKVEQGGCPPERKSVGLERFLGALTQLAGPSTVKSLQSKG